MLWGTSPAWAALNIVCNQSKWWARRHGQGDVMTNWNKSPCDAANISLLSFSKSALCVFVQTLCLWVLFRVVCPAIGSDGGSGDQRVPIFFPTHQIRRQLPWIGSPLGGYFPPGRGLGTSFFILRGGWVRECRGSASCVTPVWGAVWGDDSCCGQIKHQVARPRSILSRRTANLVNAFCEQSDHLRHGACRSSLISTLRFRDCGHRDRASPLALLLSGPRWQAALLSQRQTCRPCFRPRRPRRSPDAHGPGLMRVAPAGGERFSPRFPHQ